MKNIKISILSFLLISLIQTSLHAEEPKVLREIKDDFAERKEDWSNYKKLDFLLMSWSEMKASMSGGKLNINNKANKMQSLEIATEKREVFWMQYSNAKISSKVYLSSEKEKYAGLCIGRLRDIQYASNKNVDKEDRYFYFMVNGNGSIKILKSAKEGNTEIYAEQKEGTTFTSENPALLSIERLGLNWKFYVNEDLIYSYIDNSSSKFLRVAFACDPVSKAGFDSLSLVFYDVSANQPYVRKEVNGKLTYIDNDAGFQVIEENIDACSYTEKVSDIMRYQSKPCPGTAKKEDYGELNIIFAKIQEGEISEERMIEMIKAEQNKSTVTKNYKMTAPMNTKLGNVPVRYYDTTFELNGSSKSERTFYVYNKAGMIRVDIIIEGLGPIESNKFYSEASQNVEILKMK